MGERGSLRAYSRRRGVTLSAVQKARDTGRIPKPGKDGKIDFEAADALWNASTDLSKPRNSVTGNPKGRKAPGAPPAPMGAERANQAGGGGNGAGNGGEGGGIPDFVATYGNAKAVRETYLAKLAELDYETRKGMLVDGDAMKRAGFSAGRRARDAVLSFPDKCANRCELKKAEVVHSILLSEARKMVEDFSRGLPEVTIADLERWLEEMRDASR